jgi:hypothetical protein
MAATPVAINKQIAASRSSGTLNLSGKGLTSVPSAVFSADEPLPGAEAKWWEVSWPPYNHCVP